MQCHILTEAIENIKAFSGPMAITCILSKKKKKNEETSIFYIIERKLRPGSDFLT